MAGLIIGQYVDNWAGTKTPWFTFIGLIAGIVAGFSLLLRLLRKRDDTESNETNENSDAE